MKRTKDVLNGHKVAWPVRQVKYFMALRYTAFYMALAYSWVTSSHINILPPLD